MHKKKKKKKNRCEYILFRIDVYFSEYLLAVETERQETLGKKLDCKFIRINTSKKGYEDYEIGSIQTFISKFKNRQLRKLEKKNQTKK